MGWSFFCSMMKNLSTIILEGCTLKYHYRHAQGLLLLLWPSEQLPQKQKNLVKSTSGTNDILMKQQST
jgi:hypothetical protein